MAQAHKRKKTPGVPRINSSGAFLHWLGMLAMVVGLFAPLATAEAAVTPMTPEQALMKAAQQPFDTDTADFQRVVLVGDFQQQVGCSDWDTNCGQTGLQDVNGFWTGVFGVPPGSWNWELVAVDNSGIEYSISEGQVSVGEGQTGIYAEFNSASRDNNVWATTGIAYANGSFGDVALAQDGDGYVANALNITSPGWVDMQVTVNGEATQTGADFQEGVSRVTFDATGNITNVEHRGFAEITVQRMDADGNPLNGSCFVLDGSSQSRGCDSGDGSADGSTTLRFPGGFQPGSYTLRETSAAEGAEQLADQQIDVQPGQSTIEARSEGEPTPESGDLVVLRQDEVGNPVGGACFEIINAEGEVVASACDEDGDVADDGRIGLLDVPAGDYTLSETRTPDGFEPAADVQISVLPNDVTNQPVQSAATAPEEPIETEEPTDEVTEEPIETEEPTEEATEEPIETEEPTEEATEEPTEVVAEGRIVVYRVDDVGNPVGGSCFEVIDSNGQIVGDACDEDGIAADDGSTGVENVPVGDYTMVESRVPEGYEQAPDTPVTVTEGDVIYTVSSAAIPATEEPTEEATEEATEAPIETEEPTEEATEEPTEEATEPPTEEATEEPTAVGRIVVYREDEAGNPVGGSCFEVIDSDGEVVGANCDEDGIAADDGSTGVVDVPVGDYTMVESRVPEGYEQAPDTSVTVTEGDVIYTVTSSTTPATEEPTEEATEEPTEEIVEPPTEEATEEPTEEATEVPESAALQLTYDHDEAQPEACVELETRAAIGSMEVPFACDNGENDEDPAWGSIRIESLPQGEFDLVVYEGPAELVELDAQPVTLQEGQVVPLALESSEPAVTSFTVRTTDADGNPVGGASYILDDAGEPVLADDSGNATFDNVTPGEHTVTMTNAPAGYNFADPDTQSITVAADGTTTVAFQVSQVTTSFTVQTTDADGNPVGGASYILDESGEPVAADDSGNATFDNVTPGEHTVRMTNAPQGYNLADPDTQTVTVAADGTTAVTFQVSEITVDIVVNTVDEATGESVGGACYTLDDGEVNCDDESTGQVIFQGETPGEQTLSMETAPEGFEPVADQTIPADTTNFNVGLQQATGDIQVSVVDGDGAPVENACIALSGETDLCDEDGALGGVFTFSDVTVGEHVVMIFQTPSGYVPVPEGEERQVVNVVANETATVTFTLTETPPPTGTITANIFDESGAELPGACVQLNGDDPVCDIDDGNDGVFTFEDVTVGQHDVTITSVPDGYETPADEDITQSVDVVADTNAPITFTLFETLPATGNLDVTVLYADESSVENVCVVATNDEADITETACDDGDGVITFEGIQAGTYLITLDEEQYDGPPIEEVVPVSGTVPADETGTATLYLTRQPTTGTLEITVTADGSNVAGACITVGDQVVCDDQDGDSNATPGVISITGIEPSDSLAVSMSTPPDGYQQPADQNVSIAAGQTTSIEFALEERVDPGSVTVRTMDGGGELLNNACYQLVQGSTIIGPLCDSEPADGEVIFEDVPAGEYRLEQTSRPSNQYEMPSPRNVTVNAGDNTLVEVEMAQRAGQLRITTVDSADTSVVLQGACYVLEGGSEFGPFCDADDGNSDGIVRFTNVPAGQYELRQTVSTAGYDSAANRNVTINPGGSTQITVLNERVEPPAESGTLVVVPLDPQGNPVQGGCYQVFDGDSPVTNRICDNADDQPASITFENLPVGELTLRENLAPSPDWRIAGDINVTIANGETTTVEVPHELKPGNIVVQAVNDVGLPLQGACFTLSDSGDTDLCTDSTGQATVSGLTPGTRELTQTEAPFGYKLNETPREVTVHPGQTTTVRVVFENEPPPNTGTVQVQKFYCEAGEDGNRTEFFGGAQGNQELQQTAGCQPGIASFTLEAEDGSTESNAEFSTNEEGRAQLTAVEGIYLLTETDPDMPGNSSARLRVGVGQMTTVIVINYVAPPAPSPVTIDVEGYTCPPGFNGSSFVDFQNSCMAESQLTNQITVRAEAEGRYKRSTGDTGQLGKTSFVDLPAGTYSIWAERPHTVPVSYMFCGADVNNPGLKTVNGTISVTLESGSTILCRVFQVPPLFDADHGAIQVQKYNCPINERQRGYDYQNECERAPELVPFEIQRVDPKTGDLIGDPVRTNTNADGIVQFPMLVPGTYKLTEVDGEWCFAQSNSVDANGDVVVQKDKLSEVWVYNCVGTKSPPNTGSGDAAGLSGPDGGLNPMQQVLPNLIWPTVLLAGWLIWRERKQA